MLPYLRTLSLHVGDELFQMSGSINLSPAPLDFLLVLKQVLESDCVLDDQCTDWQKWQKQHVYHVKPLTNLGHRIDLAEPCLEVCQGIG